jgi:large subunit ribosomal protein L24
MLLDPKSGEPSRVRMRIDTDGTKERIAVKSGDSIPRHR